MFEIEGQSISLEQLQDAAVQYDMDFDTYMDTMREKGLVEKPQLPTTTQDRVTQPGVVIPEVIGDAPLSSEDFYSILKEDDGKEEETSTDDYGDVDLTKIKGAKTISGPTGSSVDLSSVNFDDYAKVVDKAKNKNKEKDRELLGAWLNEEYFGKGAANQAMNTDNIIAYQINDPTLGDLKQDFKSNLGELGISRTAFSNLTDSDLDDIFADVFSAQARATQAKEGEADERIKINDIIFKKEKDQTDAEAIEVSVDRLDNAKINSYENKLEAEFAQNVKKLKGELTDDERTRIEALVNPEIPGSLGDRLFNKDETKYDISSRMMIPTGKRIPKDKKYEIFHNPVTGQNVKKIEARAINNNGGTTVNITDAYETYLTSFKNTSQDDLAKYNSRLLLEEAGYNMENEEVGNYYVGDKTMRNMLSQRGYESNKQGVFQDVPLGVLTQLSHVPGTWDFWSPDSYMSKGEIIPQDFENKPYKNEEEFVEFLQTRRKQGNNIAAKNAALKQVYYLNRDPSTISKNRIGQFGGAFAQSMFGETITAEQFQPTNQKIIDVIGSQVVPESGVDITTQQEEIFERTFADEATEAGGGLAAMLTVLSPINKVQKALGINRMIAGLSAPRYVNKAGKSVTQSKAIKEASKAGKDLDDWAKAGGYTVTPASSLQKGVGLVTLGVYEDIKMREVLGAVTDGRMEFERGVGFGFALAPKVLPFGFGRFGRGKKYDLTTGRNQLNTFYQSTFVNAPSFALAVEGGDALGAVVRDIEGKEEYETWAKHHWSDRNTNMRRIGLNLITGKALGLMHFNAMDFKTTENIGKFQRQSVEFISKDYDVIDNLAGGTKNRNKFIAENPNNKEVQKLQRHLEDFNLATQRLDMINNSAEWTDPAKAKKTYENHYKPLTELFKSKGKEIKVEVTDKPIYQEIVKNGKLVKQEVSALYTRLGEGKNKDIATIQINTKKAKGKQYANHEGLHAYLDLMFDGNIKMKEQFTNSFKEALKSIKTPSSNLYQDILNTKDIKEIDKLEEMMAYSAEYLGKAEYYNALVGNQAFTKVKKFWNNFAESTLGHKADLTLKQDIIDLLGTYGRTGDIKKLERLNEIIEYDPTGKAREGQVATTDINKTVEQIKTRKEDVLQEIKDLRTAKPKGYENIIKEKTTLFNELNTNQRTLENKAEIEKVDIAKEGWKNQIDKNYTGTSKTKEEFQRSPEYGKVSNDILTSKGLENTIRQAATKMGIADAAKNDFVSDVKDRVLERFLKNYDPGVINKKYGRALTPFEYMTTRPPKGESIIYRSAGDVAGKYKKQVKTVASDAYEGGYGAFEGYSEQTGHMNTTETFGSKVEREGVELSEQPAMRKKVGDKTLGEIIDQKSGADAKNLDFEAKKAKEIVSYKNIQPNAERTIGKEVAVDHYGMSLEMHKKTLKSKSQWLNNKDIENILDVIKSDVAADLNMMPRWKQSIIDKYTGQEVAFDVVGGKFPSEPKATGTTTSLLKLTDASGKPLIYEPIPQTGTKGTKYKFTKRYEKWLETADQAFKTEFEQDVVEALSRGNKAEISGKLKAWIMQRKKAMYVQGVDKALPNTPELNNRFAFAEMSNQITAGKNPKLATLGELVNEVRKNIDSKFMPSLSSFQTLFKVRNFDKYRKNGNIDLFMDQWNKIESRIHGFEKSIEKQAEIMYEGRTIERSELKAIEAKNFKDMASKLKKQGGIFKDINTNEGLYDWSKSSTAVAKQNIFEAALGNKYPAGKEGLVLTALGNGKNKRWNPITEKMELISHPKGYEKTINNWFETRLGEKWTGNGKSTKDAKFAWMNDVVIKDTGDVKTKLANENLAAKNAGKTEAERIEIIHREATKMVSGKTGDFNTALEANKKLRLFHLNSIKDIIDNHAKFGLTKTEAIQAALRHVRHQTDITNGPIKGTATITAATIEVGIPVGKNEAAKNYLGTMYHAEHQMQLMNHSYTFFNSIGKNKGNKKGFKNDMERLASLFEQSITVKQDQLIYDSPLFGGNTTYLKAFKGKNLGEVSSILNIMYRPGVASTMVDLKSKTPQTIAETILENYNKRQLDILLKESAKLGKPNALHYNLKLKNNTRKVETQNRKILSESIGKKMAKTVASKDVNKVIKAVDKALENGRKIKKETKGGSFWDLDDTLFRTKSGVRYTLPNPSGKPAPQKKVIFMAGGPGSGKSSVIKGLKLEKQGFKIVNQDISLEWLMKNHGLPKDMRDFTPEQASKFGSLSWDARMIAKRKQTKFQGQGDGIIVDGTGNSLQTMQNQVREFKNKGYDVQMVFVETSLETALQRNKARKERSLRSGIVKRTHESVQKNKQAFVEMFGENFTEVKTDNLKQGDPMPKDVISKMDAYTKGYKKGRFTAEEFANEGERILAEGGKFDFSEFDYIKEGTEGPLFNKAMERAKKFGTKDTYILTARPHAAKVPIFRFLEAQGLKIPFENIITLENSAPEAKALKIAEKIGEGYNDIYFADDVLKNVQAVKNIMDQFDVKGKVQQALASKNLNKDVNNIMEHSLDIGSKKVFSKAEAKVRGKDIKRRRIFMRDSAADLELLIEPLYGKGEKGIENKKWFKKEFVMPFERGIRDYNTARQSAKNDYINLRKQNKDVVKEISKEVEGTTFTNDMAMRVYLWNKAGYKIPDLAKTTETKLVEHVRNNPKLQAYAEQFGKITKQEKGLKEPNENWWAETMAGEVTSMDRGVSRKKYLQEFLDVKNEIFNEQNLNKMESKLGTRWRENIEDMFDRMETGRTRSLKMDRGSAAMMNYLNGGIGTIMNFNTRSAVLQTISTTNFLNMRENNPIAAARAMGNVKQFSKDFMYIMNSDMLKQRRDGLSINVTEAEIASAAAASTNMIQSVISKVLKAGYTPTKLADSFAISFGGATFYRNRIKMYEKQGLKTKEAEKKAFLDFQVLSERTQQSSRADLLSKQQTSLIGRFILPFANTPMQMNRAGMKDILDISKGRFKGGRELTEKIGRISYYMGAQVAVFAGLQSALFAMLLNDDDVTDEKLANTKSMMMNSITDSFLRGFGIQGAVMSAFKNATQEYFKQSAKPGFTADYSEVAEDLLNISPPIGSKFGMLDRAGDRKKWAKIRGNDEFKFELGNPSLEASLMSIQAITNAPVYSPYQNTFNLKHAMSDQYETWQRVLMGAGWTPYSVGIETEKKKEKKKKKKKSSYIYIPVD